MSDKITLQELVESFARKCQLDPAEAALFVKEFLNLIEEAWQEISTLRLRN